MAFIEPMVTSSALILTVVVICISIRPSKQLNSNQFESSRQLYPLRSYREIQIYDWVLPNEVLEAKWRFNATNSDASYLRNSLKAYSQINLMSGRSCEGVDITVLLRWGSLPIININNASLPDNFLSEDFQQYSVELKSDSTLVSFNLSNPLPGHWYGLSYLNKVDDRISQKGLEVECQHKMTSSLSFKTMSNLLPNNEIIVLTKTNSLVQNISQTTFYKFYMNSNCFSAKLVIQECAQIPLHSGPNCPIIVYTRAMALPSAEDNDYTLKCNKSNHFRDECLFDLNSTASDAWIYVRIEPLGLESNPVLQSIEFKIKLIVDRNQNCISINNELQALPTLEPALTTYSSPVSANRTLETIEPLGLNYISLTRYDTQNSLEFKYSHVDATDLTPNQTVSVFVDIPNDRISVLEFGITPHSDIGGTLAIDFAISPFVNTSQHNVSISLCLQFNRIGFSPNCLQQLKVNTSSTEFFDGTGIKTILIPYPKPGTYYTTLEVNCYNSEYETTDKDIMSCDLNKTSILLDITSAPCLHSKCGHRGKCVQYLNGGVLFSSCLCKGGWKGWFCNDGSQAIPEDQLLLNFLLLTLSNIMFIPSVILSSYKKHFTEALVYLTTMTSSTLYHACDSDYPQSYCLLNINVLQFGDFYSAILAFWVTLVTLANMPDLSRAFFHLFGGILIAFAVESDRTSLWAFALPAGIGAAILIISWLFRCCRKSCYPSGRLWIFSILPGIALTAGGLVVYAFFETQDNYAITHSCWHSIMALALLFLVPSMKSDSDDEDIGGGTVPMPNNSAKLAHVEWRPSHTSFKFLNDDIDML